MKYAIAYTYTGFTTIEAENEASAAELFNRMSLAQIESHSEGDMLFIDSIYEDKDD